MTETKSTDTHQPTEREKRVAARQARIRALMPRPPAVRVVPTSDAFRRVLKHPRGMKFPESGSVEWPHDRFTKRRIADGSVKIEDNRRRRLIQRHIRLNNIAPRNKAGAPQQHRAKE